MSTQERGRIFTAYNGARQLARRGELDESRVNKALGLALRQDRERADTYRSTPDRCDCPDRLYRQGPKAQPCKHMLAEAIKQFAAGSAVAS